MKTVREQFDEVYAESGRPFTAWDTGVIERESYVSALDRLDAEDLAEIKKLQDRLVNCKPRLPRMGDLSALELLAKLGIFYNGIKAS